MVEKVLQNIRLDFNDECQYRKDDATRCGRTIRLSTIYFKNPILKSDSVEMALCQYHSDQILRTVLEPYTDCIKIEMSAFGKYKKGKALAKEYETIQSPMDYSKLENARKLKHKILWKICRNILCGNLLDQNKVYSAIVFHANGKFRHCFYFCSYDCFMWFKRTCGYRPKLAVNQSRLIL